ncbi:LexA family protein [Streptomyces sp. NPDC059582]|uniref:LexA family protein n=1 Tax=Streptomyces sp. NPDC059582 TaxID=3346875 RepID=UPI0036A45805
MARGADRQPATERRAALLRAHREWVAAHGEEPSVRELSAVVGLSPSTVSHHLTRTRPALRSLTATRDGAGLTEHPLASWPMQLLRCPRDTVPTALASRPATRARRCPGRTAAG